jgi:hypothetical protein
MTYRLTMALVSEGQVGNLGTDWKYELEAKVFCSGLKSDVNVEVPKHQLESGSVIQPYGAPEPVLLYEGECEQEPLLRLRLVATEVDLFVDDKGSVDKDIPLELPGAGNEPWIREIDLSAGVRESPGIRDLNSVFTLRIRLTLEKIA